MSDLAKFLLDRMDDLERVAMQASRSAHSKRGPSANIASGQVQTPARLVLAECAAKRRIVSMWAARDDDHPVTTAHRTGLGLALKALSAVYSDHPDFDPEWATA